MEAVLSLKCVVCAMGVGPRWACAHVRPVRPGVSYGWHSITTLTAVYSPAYVQSRTSNNPSSFLSDCRLLCLVCRLRCAARPKPSAEAGQQTVPHTSQPRLKTTQDLPLRRRNPSNLCHLHIISTSISALTQLASFCATLQGVVGAFVITRSWAMLQVDPSCTPVPLQCGAPLGSDHIPVPT